MHRNTYLLVIFLAILAALVVGVNIGKKISPQTQTALPTYMPTPVPTILTQTYTNTLCHFSLDYPKTFSLLENASGSAILNNPEDKNQTITIACQKDIPRPPLPTSQIEILSMINSDGSTVSANLYHDASPKDGTTIDAFIFRNPKVSKDIFIAGFGDAFNRAIRSITLLP